VPCNNDAITHKEAHNQSRTTHPETNHNSLAKVLGTAKKLRGSSTLTSRGAEQKSQEKTDALRDS